MPPTFGGAIVFGASKGGNLNTLREFAIVGCMPLRDCVSFTAVYHFCQDVSARGIEQPIKRPAWLVSTTIRDFVTRPAIASATCSLSRMFPAAASCAASRE